jgi:hypothetical protein
MQMMVKELEGRRELGVGRDPYKMAGTALARMMRGYA